MSKPKKPRFSRRPPDAIDLSCVARLTGDDMARIDKLVTYTLSPENQARNTLRAKIGGEAAARVETYLGASVSGESRAERYQDLQRAYNSKVFLDSLVGDAGGACDAGGADQTPTSNTGVTEETKNAGDWDSAEPVRLVVGSGKHAKLLEVPQRRGHNNSAAFPDWVHVTIGKETCDQYADFLGSEEDRVLILSYRLERIFGFGVSVKHKNGRNFYNESYGLGNDREAWGYVCIGGQEETILIGVNGTGLTAAAKGWEERLVHWLETEAERPKLTRVDLAYDDFTGELFNVDECQEAYENGGFQCYHGTEPCAERIGVDWMALEQQEKAWAAEVKAQCGTGPILPLKTKNLKRKGRTFAVGKRASGKYFRGYEKGRQLGASDSPWFRAEVEFKSVERVLPFDMLLQPGKYLAGAYPCLEWVKESQCRLKTHRKQLEITLQSSIDFVHRQAGQHINVLIEALGMDAFVEKVRRDGIPTRFKVADLLTAPNPIRITDRLEGLTSTDLNCLLDMHMQGLTVSPAFYGHRAESPSFRPN